MSLLQPHYRVLLHDLRNHFPRLVGRLREFEVRMRELCPLYNDLLYRVTKLVYSKAGTVVRDIPGRDILTEVVVMTLAGYKEWNFPNNARFLKERNLYKYVNEIIEDLKHNYAKLINEFVDVKNRGSSLTRDIKQTVIEVLHSNKLPGKCKLY